MNATSTKKKPSLSVVGQPGTFNAIQKVCAIMRVLGDKLEAMITRILGVLLAALAAQYVIDGVKASFG